METRELVLRNDVADVVKLEPFLEEISEFCHLDPSLLFNLNLAVEEAISNVMMYAFEGPGHEFVLSAQFDGQSLIFRIEDSGKPFDPTQEIKEADTTLSVEERPIGGLGMFLMKNIMDEISYERRDGKNVLTMKKNLK